MCQIKPISLRTAVSKICSKPSAIPKRPHPSFLPPFRSQLLNLHENFMSFISRGKLRQLRILQTPADHEAINYQRSSGRLTCNDSFNFLVCNSPAGAIALPSFCSDCENFSKLHFNFANFRRAKNVLVKKFVLNFYFETKLGLQTEAIRA